MIEKTPYNYTVLRYVHDVTTGEFINVGLVMYSSVEGTLRVRTRRTIGRIKNVFPDLNRKAFVIAVCAVERGIKHLNRQVSMSGFLDADADAHSFATRVLPKDFSSLQWGPLGGGLGHNLDETFDRLYSRFVTLYDSHSLHKRTDDEVWRPVREKLVQRNIPIDLQEKEIIGKSDSISFNHAWKNGIWHAYQPVSLDLANADGIKDKARRWLGHLAAVGDSPSEPFKLSIILGKPQASSLFAAYNNAKAILAEASCKPAIYQEDEIDILLNEIEDEARAHARVANS